MGYKTVTKQHYTCDNTFNCDKGGFFDNWCNARNSGWKKGTSRERTKIYCSLHCKADHAKQLTHIRHELYVKARKSTASSPY